MKDNLFSEMLAGLEEGFAEMDSNATYALTASDVEYAALKEHMRELEHRSPFIESVLDGEGEEIDLRQSFDDDIGMPPREDETLDEEQVEVASEIEAEFSIEDPDED